MNPATLRLWLLQAVMAAALAVGIAVHAAEPRLSDGDWNEMKRIIETQQAALKRGDGAGAFRFATRGLRAQFRDAERFMRMMHAGYQPLIDAAYSEFLEGAVIEGSIIQPLRLVMADNTVLVALYYMEKEPDGWRIAGCIIAPSTVRAA